VKTILITGGSGLLGATLAPMAAAGYKIRAAYRSNAVHLPGCETMPLDITDCGAVRESIAAIRPEVIVHAAALTAVDYCEEHPAEAYHVNLAGTENIARAATMAAAHLIYISTDYVFDGKTGRYNEKATPNPINSYGQTKLAGEKAVMELGGAWTIIRTTFYGPHPLGNNGYMERIIASLLEGKTLCMPENAFFSPLPVEVLSRVILEIARKGKTGIYHIGGRERSSKYDFVVKMARVFNLAPADIRPVDFASLNARARRPQDTSLDVDKARRELKTRLPGIEEGLALVQESFERGGR